MANKELVDALHLIADNLAMLYHRLDAIEARLDALDDHVDRGVFIAQMTWLHPAPVLIRKEGMG